MLQVVSVLVPALESNPENHWNGTQYLIVADSTTMICRWCRRCYPPWRATWRITGTAL